jgi:outer membrane protein OmpA-like peptidoglycan-associated protein
LALFCGYQSVAQLSKTSLTAGKSIYTIKGDYYSQYKNYVLAVNTYNKAIQQNPKEVNAMLGMADAYHMLGKDDLAAQLYLKALAINPDVGTEYILKYITILSASNKSAELRHWVELYNTQVAKSGEHVDSTIFVTENLTSLNSKNSDSAPLLYDNKIILSSDRASGGTFNTYKSEFNNEGAIGEVSTLNAAVNSGRVEGGFAIASNTNTFFFTGTEKESTTTPPAMEIFYSTIPTDPSSQLKVNKLSFKNFDHSLGQPTINSDGTMLYFAAHSPKHTRGFDLYHSQFNGKKWSLPVALGATINSHGDELYPMLVNDSILYFASNGHGGLGGFDIFKVNLKQAHHHPPQHLPAPINSVADEFGFVMNSSGNEYYLSSNRPGGLGGNDIYRVYKLPFKKKQHNVSKQEELFIYTSKGDQIKLAGSSKENLKFDFQPGQKYNLTVEYDNFRTGTTQTTKSTTSFTKLNFYTFDIQKNTESVYDQKSKIKHVQDVHINPGDLVTFQLVPNMVQDPDADVSKIQFQKSEAVIGDGQTIVFSYVAEGGPSISDENVQPLADLGKLDTVASKQPNVAKTSAEKSSQVTPTSSAPALATTTSASQNVSAPLQSTTAKAVDAAPIAVAGNLTHEKSKSEQVPNRAVVSSPTVSNETVTKTDQKSPVIKNTVDTTSSKPPVIAKENVVAKSEEAKTQIAPGQNNAPILLAAAPATQKIVKPDSTKTQVDVVASKTDAKNPVPSKNAVDTATSKPSVIAKENVVAKPTETQKVNKVTATEIAATQVSPSKNVTPSTPTASSTTTTSDATGIQYRVQIAASKSDLSDDQLKKIYTGKNEISSFTEEGYQKYYIEQTPNYSIAKRALNESGVPQAFIAAYQGEKKMNVLEAIALQKKNKTSPASEPEIKNPAAEQLSIANVQPNSSVTAEKSVTTTDVGKEKQVAVTATSQNVSTPDVKAPDATLENKTPVTSVATNTSVAVASTQKTTETPKETEPVTTESEKEKQTVDVTQSSQNDPKKISSPEVIAQTQIATAENKSVVNNTDKSVDKVNAQAIDPAKVTDKKITDSIEVSKEKQVAVTPSPTPSTPTKSPADVKTTDNTGVKKPSHDIAARDDFSYRLQIAASETPLNENHLKKIYQGDKEVHSFKEDGKYKYYLLETSNYFVARQTLNEVNVNQAFISAYKKDVKVPLEQAINDQYKLPEISKELNSADSVIKIATVNFEFDKFELLNDQLARLRSNAISELVKNPSYRAIVNGYTDIRGSETYNFGLSQERALFVARQMVDEGIEVERVATHYFGESQLAKYCPEHENCDESVHQANRRVEILLLVKKKNK